MIRTIALLVLGGTLPGTVTGQEAIFRRVLRMAAADQEAVIRASLALVSRNPEWADVRPLVEAMFNRYAAVPTDAQWMSDPIVSRLPAERARVIHDRVVAIASEISNQRKSLPK